MAAGRAASAHDPGVIRDDLAMGIENRLIVLDGDGAGDGLDYTQDGVAAFRLGLGDMRAARHIGADLVDELGVAVDLAGFLDQHLCGLEGDGFHGAVFEVDDAGREEEEEEDQRHQHVKVKAAALVGPPEVAVEKVAHRVFLFLTVPHPTPPYHIGQNLVSIGLAGVIIP